jgi:hypothetical protein
MAFPLQWRASARFSHTHLQPSSPSVERQVPATRHILPDRLPGTFCRRPFDARVKESERAFPVLAVECVEELPDRIDILLRHRPRSISRAWISQASGGRRCRTSLPSMTRSTGADPRSKRSRPPLRRDSFAIKSTTRSPAESTKVTPPRSRITAEASPAIAFRSAASRVEAFTRSSSPMALTTSASPSCSTRTVSPPYAPAPGWPCPPLLPLSRREAAIQTLSRRDSGVSRCFESKYADAG